MEGVRAWERRLLDGWLAIAGKFGEVQTLVLLGLVYAIPIGLGGTMSALFRADFLSKRGLGESGTAWREAESRPPTLENLKQPF